ncbi:hypothetical protein [Streptomyces sp. NPDC058773]|uniref:hypothetical protein n=1 Tax=Streptomyces sp. NPDC058773 TaxID=3346632 RepID=UPI0036B19497
MAKIRVHGFGRLLLIVMAVLLALPMGADGVYGERATATTALNAAGRTGPPGPAPSASDPSENPESGGDRCPPRRDGRSTAAVSAPTPPVSTVSTGAPVRTGSRLPLAAPLTGRQAVPVSRSGELPVHHGVFRC